MLEKNKKDYYQSTKTSYEMLCLQASPFWKGILGILVINLIFEKHKLLSIWVWKRLKKHKKSTCKTYKSGYQFMKNQLG